MAGRNPKAAFQEYVQPLQEAIGCVTPARLTLPVQVRTQQLKVNTTYALALRDLNPVPLNGTHPIAISIGQQFQIVKADGKRGPYKVRTASYFYAISVLSEDEAGLQRDSELLTYQWTPEAPDPSAITFPHVHIGVAATRGAAMVRPDTFHKIHVPTSRVSLESVIRLAITEFGVEPLKPRWLALLSRSEALFDEWKTR